MKVYSSVTFVRSKISIQIDICSSINVVDGSWGGVASPWLDLHLRWQAGILPNKPEILKSCPSSQLLAVDLDAGDAKVEVDGLDPEPVFARAFLEPDLGWPVDKLVGALDKLPRSLEPKS